MAPQLQNAAGPSCGSCASKPAESLDRACALGGRFGCRVGSLALDSVEIVTIVGYPLRETVG